MGDKLLRFAGFELDQQRAELRGADGVAIKLRPKTFEMLRLFATSGGRVLTKQKLMEAVWPNVHVGEDSLFQCIRELRTALGDERRQLIKLASGGGYSLTAEVLAEPVSIPAEVEQLALAGLVQSAPVLPAEAAAATAAPERFILGLPACCGRCRDGALRHHPRNCGGRAGVEAGAAVQAGAAASRRDADR